VKEYPEKPYQAWRSDPHHHWIDAGHTFGVHLMKRARDQALATIPPTVSEETRAAAVEAVHVAIGGMLQLLDGIFRNQIDERHRIEYALTARIIEDNTKVVETVELAPDGDGLCMGFAGWWEEQFWW
jgi:putative AlgH/UPF0301 family transcriptional regulator